MTARSDAPTRPTVAAPVLHLQPLPGPILFPVGLVSPVLASPGSGLAIVSVGLHDLVAYA